MKNNDKNQNDEKLITEAPPEPALMVGVQIRTEVDPRFTLDDSLRELELLAETAGLAVVGEVTQNLSSPNSRTFVGSGKLDEIKVLADELDAKIILFDEELSPRHQRELEKELGNGKQVIDRTALILDIFAQHANTREGMLQVELAQYRYRLPRLTGAWTHLARQTGGASGRSGGVGGVGLRGPGETQLEVDRREIKKKIVKLEDELDKVREHRNRHRQQRRKSNIPVVALVGYTNAGKSTLLNKLTKADIYVADQLFATLDPTTRQLELPTGETVLLTDTVGFIQKLPTELVAAFRATLEEIVEADLLIHMVDASHKNAQSQRLTVLETLEEIGAAEIPILTVYNKIDLLSSDEFEEIKRLAEPNSVFISALTGDGLGELAEAIAVGSYQTFVHVKVKLPYEEGRLVSLMHEKGHVIDIQHLEDGILVDGMLPRQLLAFFEEYRK
ncbi:MAG TPA: GTPase HflX [Anaerolineaceae bacterium]|nr:GTPase HflX [Anaerolineaceae bacterium]